MLQAGLLLGVFLASGIALIYVTQKLWNK